MSRGIAIALAAGLLAAAPAAAQDWRTVAFQRQHAGEESLEVDIEFGAGELVLRPAEAGALYNARIRYDAGGLRPVHTYEGGRLELRMEGEARKFDLKKGGTLDLGLSTGVPLDLDLKFGAAEAEMELGGLRIRRAVIGTGASETRIAFSRPNPEPLDRLELTVGAATFRATGLANANAERVVLEGGVGDVVLDFTGDWRRDLAAEIEMGIGSLTLRLPRGIGVRVRKRTFLMSFDSQELTKRGDAYYSANWEQAPHRLTIDIEGALGSIDVRWLDAS